MPLSAAARPPAMPARDLGSGRPLVFLHGWSTDSGFFRAQEPLAGAGLRLIMPDLPGHGLNRAAGRGLDIAALADALDALVRARRLAGMVLVGWSMGAAVAFDYLRRFGADAVAGLVVVDMSPRLASAPDWTLGLKGGLDPDRVGQAAEAMRADWRACAARIAPLLFAASRDDTDPQVDCVARALAAADGDVMADLWESLARADDRDLLPSIAVPSLIVSGAESRLYGPEVGAAMARAIPRARHVVVADAGHAPHIEQPDLFNTLLAAFAGSLGDGSAGRGPSASQRRNMIR